MVIGPLATDFLVIEGFPTMPHTSNSGSSSLYVPSSTREVVTAPSSAQLPVLFERGLDSLEDYARREPWAFAGWVFGVGFILGWKLKPW